MDIKAAQLAIIMIAIVVDYATGLIKAGYKKEYKSSVMREGLYHKVAEMIAVALMYYLEIGLPMIGVNIDFPFINFITIYVVVMEISSIIENIGEINPELVGPLAQVFEKIKEVQNNDKGD